MLCGDGVRLFGGEARPVTEPGTRGMARSAAWRARVLEPRARMAEAGGPMKMTPAPRRLGEGGVLGEEAVAGMDGVGAGAAGDCRG
jgi:hypothetical protein